MTSHWPIAAADIGGLFWVVVVIVTIVAQIVKAAKGQKQPPPASGPVHPGDSVSPEDDLRDFLKRLAQGEKEEHAQPKPITTVNRPPPEIVPPPPLPPPSPRQQEAHRPLPAHPRHQPARPVHTDRNRPIHTPIHKPVVEPAPTPQPVLAMSDIVRASAHVAMPEVQSPEISRRARAAVLAQLSGHDSLRGAILLHEILGQPLALRRRPPLTVTEMA